MLNSTLPSGALAGCKTIDLSRVLGSPYCTQILGDHGANIIKIEPPDGDEIRGWAHPSWVKSRLTLLASTETSAA